MDFAAAEYWLLLAIGGGLIGFLVGLTGVGAGSLTTPMLISGFGLPPALAVGTDLLFACITKSSGAWRHQRLGNVNWTILLALACGSLPAAAAVFGWLIYTKPDTVMLATLIRRGLGIALLVSATAIVAYPFIAGERQATLAHDAPPPRRTIATICLGILLGSVVALTSIGAGAIGVVALVALYPALSTRRLIGTDILHAIPLTLLAGIGHLGMGNVDFKVLGALLVGSLPGIAIGSRVSGAIPDKLLRGALACTLVFAAYLILSK